MRSIPAYILAVTKMLMTFDNEKIPKRNTPILSNGFRVRISQITKKATRIAPIIMHVMTSVSPQPLVPASLSPYSSRPTPASEDSVPI
ncbi:hypothetical protein D3C80_1501130 [compost metagenome]